MSHPNTNGLLADYVTVISFVYFTASLNILLTTALGHQQMLAAIEVTNLLECLLSFFCCAMVYLLGF